LLQLDVHSIDGAVAVLHASFFDTDLVISAIGAGEGGVACNASARFGLFVGVVQGQRQAVECGRGVLEGVTSAHARGCCCVIDVQGTETRADGGAEGLASQGSVQGGVVHSAEVKTTKGSGQASAEFAVTER